MRAISGKDFCKVLEREGWVLERVHSSHHIYGRPGNRIKVSVPVHGNRSLKTGMLHDLMKVAGLTDDDL